VNSEIWCQSEAKLSRHDTIIVQISDEIPLSAEIPKMRL
jgi:hypothetical protein